MAAQTEVAFDPGMLAAVQERLRHPPDPHAGLPVTRWTLTRIQAAFPALSPRTRSGLWRLLHRHGIRLRHGRPQLYSPDPAYTEKLAHLLAVLRAVATADGRWVVLFLDEFTLYHWPLVAADWRAGSDPPPCAHRAPPGERKTRIVGALNAQDGSVHYHRESSIGKHVLASFLRDVASAYPDAERICIVLDNWPVHHSPEVTHVSDRIELVFLPTYAPWLNPIEKLWDWLKDAVLRLHRVAGQWTALKREVEAFLHHFAHGSDDLLHRVGLTGDGTLARALIPHLEQQT